MSRVSRVSQVNETKEHNMLVRFKKQAAAGALAVLVLTGCGTLHEQAMRTAEETCRGIEVQDAYQYCMQDVYARDFARRQRGQAALTGVISGYPTGRPQHAPQCVSAAGPGGTIQTSCY